MGLAPLGVHGTVPPGILSVIVLGRWAVTSDLACRSFGLAAG
jgi:hypothetical protein